MSLVEHALVGTSTVPLSRRQLGGDLLSLGSGVLLTAAFAPFALWPLAVVLPVLLLWLWQDEPPWRAAWRGGLCGMGLFSTGIYWVYISLHEYGHAPAPFAALTTLLLILYLALYPAVFAYLLARWAPRPGPVSCLLVAPAAWAGLEWVRSWLLSGFPWLSIGYSQIDSPLGQIAPCLGVFAVGWAVWFAAGLLRVLLLARGRARWSWGLLLLLFWLGFWSLGRMDWVSPTGKELQVSLVQGNIPQERKFRSEELERTLRRYAELSLEQGEGSDLIIWPETAIPVFYQQVTEFADALQEQALESGTDYLIGVPTGEWSRRVFHNAVVSLGSSQGFYYKHRLLPFGEYLPLRSFLMFFRDFVDIPMADFRAGGSDQPLLHVAGQPVGVSICFEAVFGSGIRLSLPQASLLVNVSNDAWFGDSLAPHQHLQIARMRALEAGRYMARATNTGISALIDQRGRIIARSHQFETEVLRGTIQPMKGATPYVWLGDGVAVSLLAVLLVVGLCLTRGQAEKNRKQEN